MLVCSVQVVSRLDSQSKFYMFTLFSGRGSILGSAKLCKIFLQTSEV